VYPLTNLAELYQAQSKYADAEPLYKQAIAILEKAFGTDHPHVASVLKNMVEFYKKFRKEDESKRLEERAKKICLSQ
jgi:tetratricopeptide (TPR) repeat protein